MQKLSDREIVRLHQMARSGVPKNNIADELGIHRNTVYMHLALRFRYSTYVLNSLCLNASMPTGRTLSIYDAAAYLPGWPSNALIFRLYRAGVLKAKRAAGPRGPALRCTFSDIRRAAHKMLPTGLWVRSDSLDVYCKLASRIVAACDHSAVDCTYWPSKQYCYLPAPAVFEEARSLDAAIRVPLPTMRRAVLCLEKLGVAAI